MSIPCEAWKKGKKKTFLIGTLVALSVALILVGAYTGFHWFSSVEGDDLDALARQAADYFDTGDLFITKTAQRENYLAALCTDNNGKWYMCVYDGDNLFPDRWYANGGTRGFKAGNIGSWNFGSSQGEAVLIFWGAELSNDACWYTFQNNGITYTCPIENNTVLDIFIVLDGSSDINGSPTALDKNQQPLQGKSSLAEGNENVRDQLCDVSYAEITEAIDTVTNHLIELYDCGVNIPFVRDDILNGHVVIGVVDLDQEKEAAIRAIADYDFLVFEDAEEGILQTAY